MGNKLKKPKEEPSETIQTLTKLHHTITKFEKREIFLRKKITEELKLARQNKRAGKTKSAIHHMRRKNMFEKECERLCNMKINLQQQIITVEGTQMNNQTIIAMSEGQKTMKTLITNPDTIEKLRETIEEQHETAEEINTILSEPIGALATIDADELENELNELIEEQIIQELVAPITLPNIPIAPIEKRKDKEELEELEELEREMAVA